MVQPGPVKVDVVARVHARRLAGMEGARRAVRAFGEDQSAGCRLDPRDRWRMVAMGMGHEDMGDGFPAHGVEKGRDVRFIERAGVDDRDPAATDDVGHRPLEREWPGIVGEQPPHPRHHLLHCFRRKVETAIERDVSAHANRPRERTARLRP